MANGSRNGIGLTPRRREVLRLLWQDKRLSRRELHERTGVHPNLVGADVAALLEEGIIRELPAESTGPGRPRVPIEVDPDRRHAIGLAIAPGQIAVARLDLLGRVLGKPLHKQVRDPRQIVATAAEHLRKAVTAQTLAIGMSATGLIDPVNRSILFSSSVPDQRAVPLDAVYAAAGRAPLLVENDMHALAARWLLTHQSQAAEDVLLAYLEDGRVGAAMLINGQPNRGCAIGGNELGHVRFPDARTDRCFCGHSGCLERICSTEFLNLHSRRGDDLLQRAARFDGGNDPGLRRMIDYLSAGLANAVNFVRPNRLVLVSQLMRHAPFSDLLLRSVRAQLLFGLVERVRIDLWDQPSDHRAENAGWLALATLYCDGWNGNAQHL